MSSFLLIAGPVLIGFIFGWFLRRPGKLYVVTPCVEPTQLWPSESLFDRHVNHAIKALERDMNTNAATEDALHSAFFFIEKARLEMVATKDAP